MKKDALADFLKGIMPLKDGFEIKVYHYYIPIVNLKFANLTELVDYLKEIGALNDKK